MKPSRLVRAALAVFTLSMALSAQAADLSTLTNGKIDASNISGAVVFGKNGEIISLDAKGKEVQACALPNSANPKKLPSCATTPQAATSQAPAAAAPSTQAAPAPTAKSVSGSYPCVGWYYIIVGGMPVKIYVPAGCTP